MNTSFIVLEQRCLRWFCGKGIESLPEKKHNFQNAYIFLT